MVFAARGAGFGVQCKGCENYCEATLTTNFSIKSTFLSSLVSIARQPSTLPSELNEEFRRALLDFGSMTDDNVSAVDRVLIQRTNGNDPSVIALTVGANAVPLASVTNSAEGSDIPAGVRGDFPELEQADWDAVLRVVTMILTALESEPLLETGPE
ncbi:hypothetical protein [Frankia sp. Cas4]|uniref:hypothetical protein n=1 Tax=Frankia sp. Cas4 TaxID=3073927 RepID=UPI002AD37305|nr:hypothetical protein [Frankia sp. Cas4]